jgi:uncharacterized protein involved in exopolysaccharide biosynthesis
MAQTISQLREQQAALRQQLEQVTRLLTAKEEDLVLRRLLAEGQYAVHQQHKAR